MGNKRERNGKIERKIVVVVENGGKR